MIPPKPHVNEQARLASLREHEILDTTPDQAFDDIAELASNVFNLPIALVSLVDENRQWFKARVGLDLTETNRDVSFCGHTINEDEAMVVEDATQDERFHDNPLVTQEGGIRFYAGAQLRDASGLPLGTLCLIDNQPRAFTQAERDKLAKLAHQASRQLEMHRLLVELSYKSEHDELTGKLNRRGLVAQTERIEFAHDQIQAMVYLDIKRFKTVNDALGLAGGDEVLRQAAERLQTVIDEGLRHANRTTAHLARIDAGDFAVLVCTRHDENWIHDTLMRCICRAFQEPFVAAQQSFFLGVRAGSAISLPGQRLNATDALADADIAKREANRRHTTIVQYDAAMRQQVASQKQIEDHLRKAIADDRITAAFEPILDLHNGKIFGFEVLARWTDPELGRVRPDQFIPIAERCGLIRDVFEAVATRALVARNELRTQQADIWMSVNLSKTQLNDDDIFEQLAQLTQRHGVDARHLHLEVTESLVASSSGMIDQLHRLNKLGHPLMLDDFGSGTSSLSCLKSYPVQWIKVDRQLTDAADKSRSYAAIIQAVADLASNLGMRLVAEGVEEAHTIPLLQAMDVGAAQGWHWTKPLAPDEVADWHREYLRQPENRSLVA
jgi:diguanylate cyclase (GGDEF)-like protein